MKKELCKTCIITNATTGKHICTINIDQWSLDTIELMINDVVCKNDMFDSQDGVLIKYGL